jgi:hypothetical protein
LQGPAVLAEDEHVGVVLRNLSRKERFRRRRRDRRRVSCILLLGACALLTPSKTITIQIRQARGEPFRVGLMF